MRLVLGEGVDGEAIGVEHATDVLRQFQHDLVDVGGGVHLVGDGLQLLEEDQPAADIGQVAGIGMGRGGGHLAFLSVFGPGRRGTLGTNTHTVHSSNTCCACSRRTRPGPTRASISAMI